MRVSHHVKRSVCLLLSLLLLAQGMTLGAAAVGTDSVPAGTSVLEPAAYPDSEVLVLYEDGRTEVVVYEDAASLEEGLPQLARQEGVALVQPNYTYTSTALSTTDPLLAEQWALYNDGSFQLEEQENPYPVFNDPFALPSAPWQWIAPWWMQSDASAGSTGTVQAAAGVDIGAEDAWALYDGGSRDVVVALVDTGRSIRAVRTATAPTARAPSPPMQTTTSGSPASSGATTSKSWQSRLWAGGTAAAPRRPSSGPFSTRRPTEPGSAT